MALKELEQLTEEVKRLTEKLRGTNERSERLSLIRNIQGLLILLSKETQG